MPRIQRKEVESSHPYPGWISKERYWESHFEEQKRLLTVVKWLHPFCGTSMPTTVGVYAVVSLGKDPEEGSYYIMPYRYPVAF